MVSDTISGSVHRLTEYLPALFGYAMALTHNREHAEDLVQESYVRALAAADRIREDDNLKAWMFTILRNIWRNEIRSRFGRPHHESLDADEPVQAATPDPHTLYTASVERDLVLAAMDQLPVEAREILILREYEDLSYRQIASKLKRPIGTVMSRLDRARTRLRTLLLNRKGIGTTADAIRAD